jgi:PAS domain S-box-containing protein
VETAEAMREALAHRSFQLVVSDYDLPRFDALAALRVLQEHELDLPFIIVSGTIGERTAVEAMKAGAHDFLIKGALARLVPAIERELREAAERAERRRSAVALAESLERLRIVQQATDDVIWDWKLESGICTVNEAMSRKYGYDVSAVEEPWWRERLHPEDVARVEAGIREALAPGGTHWSEEFRFRAADGSWAYIIARGMVVRDAGGKATRMIGSMMDTTMRKEAEDALRRSELRLRALIEAIPDLVVVSRGGRFVFVNPSFERLFGRTSEDLVGREVESVLGVHTDDSARATRSEASVRDPRERRWMRADGVPIFVEVTAQALDFDGEPALVEVARDITDRVRAEEALRSSEERFRTLVSSIDDFVFTLDGAQRYTGAFGGWLEREGLDPQHFLDKTFPEVFGDEAMDVHTAAHARALAGEAHVYEWSMTREGEARHFQTALAPLEARTGEVVGIVGVARETTEQRRLQAQLLVSDRMASIGTLAAGVAHEINNPLAVVLANLELARWETTALDRELTAGAASNAGQLAARVQSIAESAREARESAERVRDIVRDLKIFSRSGDEEHRGPVDVKRVLDSSARMAWNEIRHRSMLVKDYADVPLVFGNEARLGQVFLNLIVNAAQAMPEGRAAQHEIRLTTKLHASGLVAIEVKDTGAGIAPEHLARIFTPFFTTKPVGVGTGLGLAICHRIVSGLGGQVEVDSELGRGTTFRVLLPVASEDAVVPRPPAPSVLPASRRGRVLVIDNEPMIGSAVRRILAGEHEVFVCTRAAEALTRLGAGERYDIILCDIMMPELTGMDFYERLGDVSLEQRARVIFLTGGAFSASARTFLDTVTNLRLEKPFDANFLRGVVNDRIR